MRDITDEEYAILRENAEEAPEYPEGCETEREYEIAHKLLSVGLLRIIPHPNSPLGVFDTTPLGKLVMQIHRMVRVA